VPTIFFKQGNNLQGLNHFGLVGGRAAGKSLSITSGARAPDATVSLGLALTNG
jgi:hypothetical protein